MASIYRLHAGLEILKKYFTEGADGDKYDVQSFEDEDLMCVRTNSNRKPIVNPRHSPPRHLK